MRLRLAPLVLVLASACGDDGGQSSTGPLGNATETSDPASSATEGPATGSTTRDTAETDGPGSTTEATAADSTSSDPDDTGEMGMTGAGPVVLYQGPVVGGAVPGWDPEAPRPLLMLGQILDDWLVTLARIDADGSLSDNTAPQIVVWGWELEPPLLYDGPVIGGSIPGWSADDPTPVVMMGYDATNDSWVSTLATIAADGSLGDNAAARILVWGWPGPVPGAPSVRYEGATSEASLPGWDPGMPEPLVILARFAGDDTWVSTLVSIGPDGEVRDNAADQLRVWGW